LVSPQTIFWEVDVQADFMLPGGALYVPGAEEIVTNIDLLVDCARKDRVFLISSVDAHDPNDPEFHDWPPHCLKGTPGANLLLEACAPPQLVIPNQRGFKLPADLASYRQVVLEKNTVDVFDNPNTDLLLAPLGPGGSPAFPSDALFAIFGVAAEYCVRYTAEGLLDRGRLSAIITDAVPQSTKRKEKRSCEVCVLTAGNSSARRKP
jgi:nicotinamidase-related amidase